MGLKENLERLQHLTREAEAAGGAERVKKQRAQGRMTARERVEFLLDRGSFVELDKFKTHRITDFEMADKKIPGDGVVTGYGTIDGRQVCIFSHDFTVFGGSLSGAFAEKVCKVMDLATKTGCPVIGLNDGSGARIQEGVVSLAGYADIFLRNVMSSGVIPQISAIMGPCAGGAVYSPAITDFIVMVRDTSYMFLTGPDVIRAATHEEVTMQELGGADAHSQKSGVCHLEADDDAGALAMIRELISYMPSNNVEDPPFVASTDDPARIDAALDSIVPKAPTSPTTWARLSGAWSMTVTCWKCRRLRAEHADRVCADGRLLGRDRGESAVVPCRSARYRRVGQRRALRPLLRRIQHSTGHVRRCAGFLPGTHQEFGGIIRHGAKLLYAFCEATVRR